MPHLIEDVGVTAVGRVHHFLVLEEVRVCPVDGHLEGASLLQDLGEGVESSGQTATQH